MHVSIELGKQRRKNSIKTAPFALFFLLGVNSPATPRALRLRSPRENVLRSRVGPRRGSDAEIRFSTIRHG